MYLTWLTVVRKKNRKLSGAKHEDDARGLDVQIERADLMTGTLQISLKKIAILFHNRS